MKLEMEATGLRFQLSLGFRTHKQEVGANSAIVFHDKSGVETIYFYKAL